MSDSSWTSACGGTEKPFICKGEKLLYMWNKALRIYRYYNITKDTFLEQDDLAYFGLNS
jgi:hypothetical protein